MTTLQQALLDKAGRALEAARASLDRDDAETATNRAYYACFYAAQAALVSVGEQPKTHTGTHTRFRLHFVAGGVVPLGIGSILTDAFAARQRHDYNAFAVTDTHAAADLLADAERFVAAVSEVIEGAS